MVTLNWHSCGIGLTGRRFRYFYLVFSGARESTSSGGQSLSNFRLEPFLVSTCWCTTQQPGSCMLNSCQSMYSGYFTATLWQTAFNLLGFVSLDNYCRHSVYSRPKVTAYPVRTVHIELVNLSSSIVVRTHTQCHEHDIGGDDGGASIEWMFSRYRFQYLCGLINTDR